MLRLLSEIAWRDRWFRVPLHYGTVRARDVEQAFRREANVAEFLRLAAGAAGTAAAYGYAGGRMALYAVLRALPVGPGDEVILPAYTCVAVPNAIRFAGARPVYADIDPRTYNLDPVDVERRIGPRTRVILAQHTYGLPAPMDHLLRLSRSGPQPICVVEDGCHALGATLGGRRIGSLASAAFFSTDATKMVCTDIGGFAVASDAGLQERLARQWRSTESLPARIQSEVRSRYARKFRYTRRENYWGWGRLALGWEARAKNAYGHSDERTLALPTATPYPARFPETMAAAACSQLEGLAENLAHRRRVAAAFRQIFREIPQPALEPQSDPSWLQFPLRVRDPGQWRRVFNRYVHLSDWFSAPAYGLNGDPRAVGYQPGSCPAAETVHATVVAFPTHALVDDPVVATIERLYKKNKACLEPYSGPETR